MVGRQNSEAARKSGGNDDKEKECGLKEEGKIGGGEEEEWKY